MFKKEAPVSQILHGMMKRCNSWKQLSMKFRLQYIHFVVFEENSDRPVTVCYWV